MKWSLINPRWEFEGSIYFGCREAHLPLEYGYSRALLTAQGHQVQIVDAQMFDLTDDQIRQRVSEFAPDFTVVTTAPSYLFWRCAPPELRIPQRTLAAVRDVGGTMVVVGPHASTTPLATLRKTGADVVVIGECEEILPQLTGDWSAVPSIAWMPDGVPRVQGGPHSARMDQLPALHWEDEVVRSHPHQHHRFDQPPVGPGAEMECSRGCPYHCTFCAKDNFRNLYRKRPAGVILEELDGLLKQGAEYIYFIDEIYLPDQQLLEEFVGRKFKFGIQTRIDLWNERMLELLGRAGCVSVEAGVESITPEGRQSLDKKCRMSTQELSARLIFAKQHIPFVQANLIQMEQDDEQEVEEWRQDLQAHGVWANRPVPLFPYPGSPDYTRRWGAPDDHAWERALGYYLGSFDGFSDIQDQRPLPLSELEQPAFRVLP
jgi:B12-binding domain/radical SAM domain protein of rhizo-twelve system